jgi:serine/threonine protein phosphatase PrpC
MLWVGQFGMEHGEAKQVTPWVGLFPGDNGAPDGKTDLYLVVEPATPGSEDFCSDLKEAIGDLFLKEKASLTGSVLRSLHVAHENLREWNRQSIKDHRIAAGVSCLALRGQEAYLAQVGPATAVLYRTGAVMRMEPRLPEAIEPLGLHEEFRPEFSRFELEDDDRLMILSPSLAERLTDGVLSDALARPGEDALPEIYKEAKDVPDCGAVLVACTESRSDLEDEG